MLEGLPAPVDSNLCKVSKLAADLSPEDNSILQDAMKNPAWSTTALCIELNKRGLALGETVLRRHRTVKCSCAR